MNIQELLDYTLIRQWAERQESDDTVGVVADGARCPFANCLKDRYPEHEFYVTGTRIEIDHEGRVVPPDWMADAIREIDSFGYSISGAQFFSILKHAQPKEEEWISYKHYGKRWSNNANMKLRTGRLWERTISQRVQGRASRTT